MVRGSALSLRGIVPGCATSTFKLVLEWKKGLGRIEK